MEVESRWTPLMLVDSTGGSYKSGRGVHDGVLNGLHCPSVDGRWSPSVDGQWSPQWRWMDLVRSPQNATEDPKKRTKR